MAQALRSSPLPSKRLLGRSGEFKCRGVNVERDHGDVAATETNFAVPWRLDSIIWRCGSSVVAGGAGGAVGSLSVRVSGVRFISRFYPAPADVHRCRTSLAPAFSA
jgi:hypothetical protein